VQLLESMRADDPEEQFWTGVHGITPADAHVDIEWHEPLEPHLLDVDRVRVECHLYDPDALAEAERRRAEPPLGERRGLTPDGPDPFAT
jgi:hypothetical protein